MPANFEHGSVKKMRKMHSMWHDIQVAAVTGKESGSSVNVVFDNRLDDWGSILGRGKYFSSSLFV
jgi:hypothetical protein